MTVEKMEVLSKSQISETSGCVRWFFSVRSRRFLEISNPVFFFFCFFFFCFFFETVSFLLNYTFCVMKGT